MSTFITKRLILAITVLVVGAFGLVAGASATTVENFDTYNTGQHLGGQGSWLDYGAWDSCFVVNDRSFSGQNSVNIDGGGQCANYLNNFLPASSTVQFWFYFTTSTDIGYTWRLGTTEAHNFVIIDSHHIYLTGGVYLTLDPITTGVWHNVIFSYDQNTDALSGSYDYGAWSTSTFPYDENELVWQMGAFQGVYFDSLSFGTTTDFTSCDYLPVDTCIATSGCYYNFVANSCFPVNPVYECGTGWFLGFCDTAQSCTDHAGYWYNENCWSTPSATTTSWSSYYADHSDFATPTAFITFLSGFTSPFLENIENWLNSFLQFFDKSNAIFYGEKLGGAIPVARSYLGIFNSFFGDFPISEIFLFFITAMVVFVVYKQIRNLINLIKP
jgi:hypothetical protein